LAGKPTRTSVHAAVQRVVRCVLSVAVNHTELYFRFVVRGRGRRGVTVAAVAAVGARGVPPDLQWYCASAARVRLAALWRQRRL
jgi:hypothetical protein